MPTTTITPQQFQELLDKGNAARKHPRSRYAPSPTGPLHLGNARTALIAWLQARLAGAAFVLRMEDLDKPRVKPGSAQQILDDLHWLGLDWDEGGEQGGPFGPYEQSLRDPIYQAALDLLHRRELVFRCYCSRKDIATASGAPHGGFTPYPGICRGLSPERERQVRRQKNNRVPSWRYRVPEKHIHFEDRVAGPQRQSLDKDVGDFILHRRDGLFAYQLAVVVDDALMGITDVVRGMDLLDSSPRQIELFEALGAKPPTFWHVPLLMDENGQRMAKRDGSASLAEYREAGQNPQALIGRLAASLGLVPKGVNLSAQELCASLDLETLRRHLIQAARHPLQWVDWGP